MAIAPAQLEWAWLGRVVLEPDPNFAAEDVAKTSYVVTPNVDLGELVSEEDGALASVLTVAAEIAFSRTDGSEGPSPFTLDISVHGVFRWSADALPPTHTLARGWLEYNGMYLLWPYLRAFVATITGLTHLPPLTIYTMNVPKPPLVQEEPDTADDGGEERDEAAAATGG